MKMTANLLYEDREWNDPDSYYDAKAIREDLQLYVLFRNASREQEMQEGTVQHVVERDTFLEHVISKVMLVPLKSEAEICYRQEIMKDFMQNEQLLKDLYNLTKSANERWEAIGKDLYKKNSNEHARGALISKIQMLQLFIGNLVNTKKLLTEYEESLSSKGLLALKKRFCDKYSDEFVEGAVKILEDCAYITDGMEEFQDEIEQQGKVVKKFASVKINCNLSEGLKMDNIKVEQLATVRKKVTLINQAKERLSNFYTDMFDKETKKITDDVMMVEEQKRLEMQIAEYAIRRLDNFSVEYRNFFSQIYFQLAFYRAAFNLYQRSKIIGLPLCYPKVCRKNDIKFQELMEFSMAIFRKNVPIGNTAEITDKMMLVITGANQGGKSTFARSVGIAQVMFQCGMFVCAEKFESAIFTGLFTHFTRREDSTMSSGRLDEEMKRMDDIINHLEENSFIILNESFATTTEEEGSVIEYGITKALMEAGVKILTVTHLLSYARKLYAEHDDSIEFFAAERLENGDRTFKMIQSEPELTSFGLDLYEQIITSNLEMQNNAN